MTGHVIVVDDEAAIREAVQQWLELSGFRVHSCATAQAALALVDRDYPGIIISDVRMPGTDGLQLLDSVLERDRDLPVILITGHGDVPMAVQALRQGAYDFIEKPFGKATLIASLDRAKAQAQTSLTVITQREHALSRLNILTDRERDVLRGLVAGLPNKTIAYDLGISPRTVEIHRSNLMLKLNVRSLSEVLRIAFQAGVS